jgi:hypothetical protein
MSETLNSKVRSYNTNNTSQQNLSGGCDYYRVKLNSLHRNSGDMNDATYTIHGVFPNNNAKLLNGGWEVFLEDFNLPNNSNTPAGIPINVSLPTLVNVGKDFETRPNQGIQPTSRVAGVYTDTSRGTNVHAYNNQPIGRGSIGHSITPQQLFQGSLTVALRNDVGAPFGSLNNGNFILTNLAPTPVNYTATLLFVHRY